MVNWMYSDGTKISCEEKLKVLNENIEEIKQTCQDALDDAVLIGCSEDGFKIMLQHIIDNMKSNYIK